MPSTRRPSNFSWIVDGVLAGSAYPSSREHFEYYKKQNIKHVVSLTEWQPPLKLVPADINLVFMPVVEFQAPTVQQLEEFVNVVKSAHLKNEAVVVHCHWGRGRTGTMLAAYLIQCEHMSPWDAITHVREQRPHSIETYQQEDLLFHFAELVEKQSQVKTTVTSTMESDDQNQASSSQLPSKVGGENSQILPGGNGASCSDTKNETEKHFMRNGDQFS